jgi:hypothetical protein
MNRAIVADSLGYQHWMCCVGDCDTRGKLFSSNYYSVQHAEDEGWRPTVDPQYVDPTSDCAGYVCPTCTKLLEEPLDGNV